jgi:hypothetical protein
MLHRLVRPNLAFSINCLAMIQRPNALARAVMALFCPGCFRMASNSPMPCRFTIWAPAQVSARRLCRCSMRWNSLTSQKQREA